MDQVDQGGFNNQRSHFLTAREAAELLGVKVQTVYAYASRGKLRSVSGEGHRRLYPRDDVERLRTSSDARAGHSAVAAGALRWGQPVLESAVTEITDAGPRYRGHLAADLALADVPFESVAELLWTGRLPSEPPVWSVALGAEGSVQALSVAGPRASALSRLVRHDAPPVSVLSLATASLALDDASRFLAPRDAELRRARGIVLRLAASLALVSRRARRSGHEVSSVVDECLSSTSVARSVAMAYGLAPRPTAIRAIDRALVLCADHELNVSTFAARVAASAGADLYASIGAGLGALSGPKHGGMTDRVEAVVDEVGAAARARRAIHGRLRRGERVPGFGHPLYPTVDPRVPPMLELARASARKTKRLSTVLAMVDVMQRADRGPATIDIGLVALRTAVGLPRGAAAALFALGRTAGWVAHVLEQRDAGFLLRPRARYTGETVPSRDA